MGKKNALSTQYEGLKIMVKLADEKTLKSMAPLVYAASKGMQLMGTKELIKEMPKAIAELNRLKTLDADGLAKALKSYKWTADSPVDNIPLPWQVVARRKDDCDGSAVLVLACRPAAKMYLICWVEGGMMLRFSDWHYVAFEPGAVWSNFRRYETNDLRGWVQENYPWATILVEIDPAATNPRSMIKTLSAL